jgi:hypothetical protein
VAAFENSVDNTGYFRGPDSVHAALTAMGKDYGHIGKNRQQ